MAYDARAIGNWGCPPESYRRRSSGARRADRLLLTSNITRWTKSSAFSRRACPGFRAARSSFPDPIIVWSHLKTTAHPERSRHRPLRGGSDVRYEKRPAQLPDGTVAEGLFNAWIWLDNPSQFNPYTTGMVKGVIRAFRAASNARDVVAVVFTGAGDKAFCTGGNTKEYAEYYAGNPQEYRQYMRLFNDMVSAILGCDKPVIARVNGMRIGGGQEIGMACDFSIAQDLARFGQAGPKHGSAAIGGATDFLPLMVGAERAMESARCASRGRRTRLIGSDDHRYRPGVEGRWRVCRQSAGRDGALSRRVWPHRPWRAEDRRGPRKGKALMARGAVDLSLLDEKVEALCAKLLLTFPECLTKSLEELRKPKLQAWNANKEDSRAWLALNMMAEARTGFRAFNEGPKNNREIDFVELRRTLARASPGPRRCRRLIPKA